ncbi:MAG: hypothetical protein K9L74_00455 [Candidatus Izimaplasma sp.]|nr:hypothetical protein [Candidatus Izimaplasma bacterium]
MSNILVIGAQNIDIFAYNDEKIVLHDSNLANIELGVGGVSGNIVSNLANLGLSVSFITVFGNDLFGDIAQSHFKQLQIDLSHTKTVHHKNSVYLATMDDENDLFVGFNDMKITRFITVPFLKKEHDYIKQFSTLVIDNNLEQTVINYLLTTYKDSIIVMDGVSTKKIYKIKDNLSQINLLKMNKEEALTLTDKKAFDTVIDTLVQNDLESFVITNKNQQIYYHKDGNLYTKTPKKVSNIKSTSGAGDAFLSGIIAGLLKNYSPEKQLNLAIECATKTMQSTTSNTTNLKEVSYE